MDRDRIPEDIARIALDKAEGFPFERFALAFYGALVGARFVPLGGVRDGGADARDGTIYEDDTRSDTFYQASVEVDTEGKIRRTVARLREFGRDPKVLVYMTSRTVKYSDRLERELTSEMDVTIHIRDGGYIALHINDDPGTRGAFDEHLRFYTDFLQQVGASRLIGASRHVRTPAVYVFLAQELDRRQGDESLVDSITDSLALWALEGTDPDAGILRSVDEIMTIIDEELPGVHAIVQPRLRLRLERMAAKSYEGGRAVRWHKHDDRFCLPFETREAISEENTADESLRFEVLESFDDRLRTDPIDGLGELGIRQAAETALRTLQLAFEREGLEFSSYLQDTISGDFPTIVDSLREALIEGGHTGSHGQRVGDGAFMILRAAFYNSRDIERQYLQRLARTYALLFTLNTEPRLLEFFQDMAGDFHLYVGADQIVRALSEHYLNEADRMTRNTLLIASRSGARLILTEPALREVVHHLRSCDLEYTNFLQGMEHEITYDIAREAPQILLRAYLYSSLNLELGRRRPRSWSEFVGQFLSFPTLHRAEAYNDLRLYLQATFGFLYESTREMQGLVDPEEVSKLAAALCEIKDERLADNDALISLAVYGKRRERGETSRVSEFGWVTWWLTGETRILKYTQDIVSAAGARYLMRPDFLLNFLTLAPSASEARRTFAKVFPSLLGIRLARHVSSDAFNEIMRSVAEAESLDDARRTVEIGKIVDRLKSDVTHQFVSTGSRSVAAIDVAAERDASGR